MNQSNGAQRSNSSSTSIGAITLGVLGVCVTFEKNTLLQSIFIVCSVSIVIGYFISSRMRKPSVSELATPPLTPHVPPAQSERRIFIVEQLALQSQQLAEHLGALNDIADATVELTESITHEAEETPEETRLVEMVDEIRILANEMLIKVQGLRGNTASMQHHVAQIIATVERSSPG